jgi:pimeloyl-ACP methyl ester carboxylesterase
MTLTTTPVIAQPTEAFCSDARLSYLVAGSGAHAILLLHGWGAFKELWWSTLLALGPDLHAFAPDLPGHGGSPLDGDSSMSRIAMRVARFCDARGLQPITLVGHSMGGNIALELVLARPDLVSCLVLVDPAAQEMPIYRRSHLGGLRGWTALRTGLALARRLEVVGRRVPHVHQGGFVLPAIRRATYMARHDAEALHRLLAGLIANPIGPRLAKINLPTLVITGEFDPLVPPALSQRIAEAIPGAQYALVRGAGHNPMDERPREFERTLLAFLAAQKHQAAPPKHLA